MVSIENDRYTTDADRTGDKYLAASLRSYHSIVWLIRDDLGRAAKDIEGLLDAWPGDRYQWQHFTHLFARCEQAIYADTPERAYHAFLEEDPKKSDHQTGVAMGMAIEAAVQWLTPESDRKNALALLEQAIAIADTEGATLLAEAGRRWLGEHVGGIAAANYDPDPSCG